MSVRVRFAPSPTGPLHIGGVRTALYNYLFAKKNKGTFILRIEDTDQTRYVEGAEQYIIDSLNWCGMEIDEGPDQGGKFGPYRQSERKDIYIKYAHKLVELGHAYYAFDSAEELEKAREDEAAKGNHNFKYGMDTRNEMKNSISMSTDEVKGLLDSGADYTIRLKIPKGETITFKDSIRDEVSFSSDELDDKVILKGDGMPTYHLANIVDDHLMEITHVIRGEEWLSSTAHHVLMYRFFDWTPPTFAHLPLILKPSGQGKLSKRDGAKFGFPVFPMDWNQEDEETFPGFKEQGFLPAALLNFLAFLGWNPGDDREMMSLEELIEAFDVDRIVKSGAKFDYEKAKWYNQQYLIAMTDEDIADLIVQNTEDLPDNVNTSSLQSIVKLMKERVYFYTDILTDGQYLYENPAVYDTQMLNKKYKKESANSYQGICELIDTTSPYTSDDLSDRIKGYIADNQLKMGEILPVLRIALTGTMKGPDLFETIHLLGSHESIERINYAINELID
jgi:glutamyl-tRNA synthetase